MRGIYADPQNCPGTLPNQCPNTGSSTLLLMQEEQRAARMRERLTALGEDVDALLVGIVGAEAE